MMNIQDFAFIAFSCNASLILKKLRDKRMTRKLYASDSNIGKEDLDGSLWFNVPIGTKRSNTLEEWARDCEKMNMDWEIRQDTDKSWTIFLFSGGSEQWVYNKQVRSFETMRKQHEEWTNKHYGGNKYSIEMIQYNSLPIVIDPVYDAKKYF